MPHYIEIKRSPLNWNLEKYKDDKGRTRRENIEYNIKGDCSDKVIKHMHLVADASPQNPILVVDRTASRAPPATLVLLVHFHYMMPAPKTYLPKI